MLDVIYNAVILILVVVWVLARRSGKASQWGRRAEKRLVPVSIVLWFLLVLVLAFYVLSFNHIATTVDVDDAVKAAVTDFLHGGNPYRDPVVPRFAQLGQYNMFWGSSVGSGSVWAYGTYNYLPLDLLVYSIAYWGLHFLGSPTWFVLTNVALSFAALSFIHRVIRPDWRYFAPIAGIAILVLSFNNTSLTLLFIAGGAYARQRFELHKETTTAVLLGLAALTKAFAAIPFLAFALYDIQTEVSDKNRKKLFETLAVLGLLVASSFALVAYFGVSHVLDSTVFVYAAGKPTWALPVGGTPLVELIPGNQYYGLIAIACVAMTIAIGLRFVNVYDRILLAMVTLLLVMSQMTYSPVFVLILYLVVHLEALAEVNGSSVKIDIPHKGEDQANPEGTSGESEK